MSHRDEGDCESVPRNDWEGPSSDFEPSDGPLEEFRGFENVPKVVVERLDVTPQPAPKLKPILKEKSKFSLTNKFFLKCTVDIFNQDLNKLKDLYSKKPDLLNTPTKSNMSLKCNICDKEYSSEKKLLNHHENKHVIIYKPEKSKSQKRVSFSEKIIIHEVKEYHKCRKCPKIFESYVLLKSHTKEQHRKRKCYICNYCSKKFVDRMFFKVHIKLHCEACGELFPSKTLCNLHRRFVCRTLKLHECKTCKSAFFRIMDLKDHSYDHIEDCFVCDICKDQCKTKCAIAHHIYFLHSKRRKKSGPSLHTERKLGTERLYLCRFCEESSVDKDVIEAHVNILPDFTNRAMTGYKDYYFCDQCLLQFDKEQDMLQHKWTHFLKTDSQPDTNQNMGKKNLKRFYNINEEIPDIFKPKLVLKRLKIEGKEKPDEELKDPVQVVRNNFDIPHDYLKKAIVNKSKKTILSKHQCETCGKYFSTAYCLRRHVETLHMDFENLRCKVCEEIFVWPSLLQTHKCIRLNLPEMPFDDARPEIHFENLKEMQNQYQSNTVTSTQEINGLDDFNINDDDDYMNAIDFELPEPIVELTEGTDRFVSGSVGPTVSASPLTENVAVLNQNSSVPTLFVEQGIVAPQNIAILSQRTSNLVPNALGSQNAVIFSPSATVTNPLTERVIAVNQNSSALPLPIGQVQQNMIAPQNMSLLTQRAGQVISNSLQNKVMFNPSASATKNIVGLNKSMALMVPSTSPLTQSVGHLTQSPASLNSSVGKVTHFHANGIKLVVQEVPIEF